MKIPGTSLPIPYKSLPLQEKAPTANTQSQAIRPTLTTPPTVPLAALLRTLGLPTDRLSVTILSFARFFSLPLDPAMLANVRQQAGRGLPGQTGNPASPSPGQPPTAQQSAPATLTQQMQAADSREALALAALAAADKGVKLSEKALAEYVDAIDPDRGGQDQGDAEGQQGKEKNQQGNEEKPFPPDEKDASPDLLKKQVTEQSNLLNTLNRLPGKDGRRWMVFPFSFSEGGAEFRASLRLLLDESGAGKMSLDIARHGGQSGADSGSPGLPAAATNSQRWLFVADSKLEQVQVYIKPQRPAPEQQKLAGEVARFLEVPPERVNVRCGEFPFAPDCRNDEFMPVDEAV